MSFMDAREHGSKIGGAGVASAQHEAIDRRERLRRLALETIDLAKDPYFMRNHLGRYDPDPANVPKPPTTHAFRVRPEPVRRHLVRVA